MRIVPRSAFYRFCFEDISSSRHHCNTLGTGISNAEFWRRHIVWLCWDGQPIEGCWFPSWLIRSFWLNLWLSAHFIQYFNLDGNRFNRHLFWLIIFSVSSIYCPESTRTKFLIDENILIDLLGCPIVDHKNYLLTQINQCNKSLFHYSESVCRLSPLVIPRLTCYNSTNWPPTQSSPNSLPHCKCQNKSPRMCTYDSL